MSKSKVLHYEKQAERYLNQQGLSLVQRNYNCRFGEIDLIMHDGEYLCCIEVKYRHNNLYGGAAYSIPYSKQNKIIRTALHFLSSHPAYQHYPLRFDALLFQPDAKGNALSTQWITSAFDAEER